MARRTGTIQPAYFDTLYAADPDPWRFATSEYEAEKYAATMAALPARRFPSALEIGCSVGILTQHLAAHCDDLLAIDVAEAALQHARARNPGVRFERRAIPAEWPEGRFDLIVCSEVLYYLDAAHLAQAVDCAVAALQPGGSILAVHYLGETDYPLTGDEAAEGLNTLSGLTPGLQLRKAGYRIDRLDQAGAPAG